MEIIFYYTGIHCGLNFNMEGATSLTTGPAAATLVVDSGQTATLTVTLLPDQDHIINREYVSVINTRHGTDVTDQYFYPNNNTIVFNNITESFSNMIIKVSAISNKAYTSIYTGLQVDEGIGYTQAIEADKNAIEGINTYTPAQYAEVNAATLEGFNSSYFCPADRITTNQELGLIKKGAGFVLEPDGTLNTDIKVQINHYTNTIDLFINTSEE